MIKNSTQEVLYLKKIMLWRNSEEKVNVGNAILAASGSFKNSKT